MLLTELLENLLGRTESRRRRDRKQFHVAQIAEAVEERCLLSGTYGGYEYHEFPPAAAGSGNTGASQGAMNPLTSIPQLSSLPGAPVTIYLDFDGHTETQDWPGARSDGQTGAIITPVFDIDNDFTTFSDEELRLIEEVWYRVAEDYAPFNVNVTTIDPGSYNDFSAVLVSIGGNGSWIGSPGGIAFVNSFNNSAVNTCYVFSDNTAFGSPIHAKGMALAASHEVGHMLGLLHHSVYDANGNQTAQYDSGRPDLGPIMGAPYNSERETWSSAPDSNGPTSIQDDLVYMTRAQNLTFAFRQDDHGNSISNATPLDSTVPDVSGSGIIERNDDVDFFSFETDTGTVSFDATGLDLAAIYSGLNVNAGTNLDLVLSLYDSNGTLIATDNPTNSLSASLSASVSAGTYYIAVSGTGQYGALGSYTLSGTVIPLPTIPTMLSPTGTLSILNPTFQWSQGSGATSYELEVANLTLNRSRYYVRTVSGTTHVAQFAFVEGDYTARVRTIAADGTLGTWSNTIAFTLDVPAPSKPIISRPLGEIATSFPTFVWNSQAAAFNYTLEVRNADTDERVIFRTNHEPNTYLHFNPLPDGNYVATVQAFNILGEPSAVSDPVAFSIDSPPPVAPTITGPTATTTDTSPRIEWTEVQDAWRYDLWVNYRNGGVAQYIRETKIEGDNFYQTLDLPQGTYIAWVRAINGNGEVGPWSTAYFFTVDILPPGRVTLTGPAAVAPATVLQNQFPTFTWDAVERATTYDLWVNNETTRQTQIIREQSLTSTSFTSLTKLPEGRYNAWVRAKNSANEVGPWSTAWKFEIDLPRPTTPVFTGPTVNPAGSVTSSTPTFTWTADVQGDFYQLWVNDVTTGKRVLLVNDIVGESYQVPVDQRFLEHTYDVWVRAYNSVGEYSAWSAVNRIRIDIPNPTTPIIIGPSDTVRTSTPVLQWVHSSESVRYEVIIRDLERQENIVLQVRSFQVSPAGDVASFTLPNANALGRGTYRFWVRAFNSLSDTSAWSASKTFAVVAYEAVDAEDTSELVMLTSKAVEVSSNENRIPASDSAETNSVPENEVVFSTRIVEDKTVELAIVEESVMAEFADPTDSDVGQIALGSDVSSTPQTDSEQQATGHAGITAAMLALLPFRERKRRKE